MKDHSFTVILTTEPTDDQADTWYGRGRDGTLATVAGTPQIQFTRAAASLEDAVRSAMQDVRAAGLVVARVELVPDRVLPS